MLARVARTRHPNHQFDAFGNLKQVSDAYGNVSASVTYNVRGMRTQLADMNLGTWTFTPNALGEVVSQLDAKSQTTTFAFDRLGRLTSRTEAEGTSTWTWGQSSAAKNVGRLASVAGPGYSESLSYNTTFGQLVTRSISTDATYNIDYEYNNIGALHTLTYPTSTSGVRFKVKYGYSYGYQASVRDFTGDVDGTVLWSLTTVDPRGNPIDESYGNGLRVITGFNPLTGLMDYRTSGTGGSTTNVQNLSHTWDTTGNLSQRQDGRQSLTEAFHYDSLNRFDYSTLNGSTNLDVTLDLIGNITYKSDVGSYTYHATKKHAVTAAGSSSFAYDSNGNVTTRNGSTITWASYNLPTSISGSGQTAQFWYAPDRSRWKQVSSYAGGSETTIYVGGVLEKMTASASGITRWRHLIPTPGANIIHVRRSDGTTETNYLAKDHIGSTDAIVNASGTVLSYFSYAAYGARRKSDWSGPPSAGEMTAAANYSRRGFTEHEMLDNVGLVHMNGRVIDPLVGRFMSSDPIADGLGVAAGFNRFSYVRNAPLSQTDPSGLATNAGRPAWKDGPQHPSTQGQWTTVAQNVYDVTKARGGSGRDYGTNYQFVSRTGLLLYMISAGLLVDGERGGSGGESSDGGGGGSGGGGNGADGDLGEVVVTAEPAPILRFLCSGSQSDTVATNLAGTLDNAGTAADYLAPLAAIGATAAGAARGLPNSDAWSLLAREASTGLQKVARVGTVASGFVVLGALASGDFTGALYAGLDFGAFWALSTTAVAGASATGGQSVAQAGLVGGAFYATGGSRGAVQRLVCD